MSDATIVFPAANKIAEQFKTVLIDNPKHANSLNNKECQIAAKNDSEALNCWLQEYKGKTYIDYQREGRRLLLWCLHIQKKSLGMLKAVDFKDYFAFLQNPPMAWRMEKGQNRRSVMHPNWRPFNGALTKTSLVMAIRIINSLINYLVEAQYLATNPLKLIKKYTSLTPDFAAQKYQVWQHARDG